MALTKVTTHVIADDIALGGNPTTTTQSAGNDTTRIATTAFVQTELSSLVDSAPSTLNTLNELAAALGDDANFSTTVTNSIAEKLPLAGGTMTGNIAHASDFTIDVGGDIILDAGGGDFDFLVGGTEVGSIIRDGSNLQLKSSISDGDMVFRGNDGGSIISALTLDMSDAGFATFNSGVKISGDSSINRGNQTSGELLIGGTTDGGFVDFDGTAIQLNTQRDPNTGTFINTSKSNARIELVGADGDAHIKFRTTASNNTSATERMRIDKNGNVLIGATSTNFGAFSASTSPQLQVAGSMPQVLLHETDTDKDGYIGISGSTMFMQTADAIPIRFGTSDTEVLRLRSDGSGLEFPDNNTFISTASSPGGTSYEWGSIRRPASSDGGQLSIRQYSTGATAAAYPAYAGGTSGWDENTGMYFPAADKVGLSGGGTVQLETGAQSSSDMAAVKVNNQTEHKAGKLTVYGGSSSGTNGGILHWNGVGREYRNVVSTQTSSAANRYWHIKTNIQATNYVMFIGRVHGYSYGNSGHIVDIQRSGYAHSSAGTLSGYQVINNGSSSDTLTIYYSSDDYIVFKHSTPSSGYYSGLSFDIKMQSPTGYNFNFEVLAHSINSTSGDTTY